MGGHADCCEIHFRGAHKADWPSWRRSVVAVLGGGASTLPSRYAVGVRGDSGALSSWHYAIRVNSDDGQETRRLQAKSGRYFVLHKATGEVQRMGCRESLFGS